MFRIKSPKPAVIWHQKRPVYRQITWKHGVRRRVTVISERVRSVILSATYPLISYP